MPGRWHDPAVAIMINRAALAHRLFTGISQHHLAFLARELAVPWQAGLAGRRHAARGGARKRAAGAGARHQLMFVDQLAATLIRLRHDLPHSVLGLLFGVDRSTITRAIAEVRPLPAERGCAVPDHPGRRLRTLTDVFAYTQAEGVELRLRHRDPGPPAAGRTWRKARVRLGQDEAEHHEGHRHRRLARPHVMDRCPAAPPLENPRPQAFSGR